MPKVTPQVYQLKITLVDSKPPIWRRILLSSETTLLQLHHIIQVVMPWEDYHLHQFEINGEYYSAPLPDGDWLEDTLDERRVKLRKIVPGEGFKFIYWYDFGDSWYHNLLVEKILPLNPEQQLPLCIKGKRACPPEDSGGIWSYPNFLEALNDSTHPDHEMLTDWIGGSFDAEAFDLEAINKRLRSL
jgi:hypothetical protein